MIAVKNKQLIVLLDSRCGRNGGPNPVLISNLNNIFGAISATLLAFCSIAILYKPFLHLESRLTLLHTATVATCLENSFLIST